MNSERNVLKCGQNAGGEVAVEERGRLEMEADESRRRKERKREREKEREIGWEMRDCIEPKSQPAGPACCLGDCKLSLRMQTDKQDRHHLPILPSTPETVADAVPFCSPSLSVLHSTSRRFLSPVHMHVYELPNPFPLHLPPFSQLLRYFPSVSTTGLFFR